MEIKQVPLSGSGFRSKLTSDYLSGEPALRPFYAFQPSLDAFKEAVQQRSKLAIDRNLLHDQLLAQHAQVPARFVSIHANIESLKSEKTFTVTTGHQLCIAGGLLFFVYKLITTINLAADLKLRYPDFHFVPVYWMATEDHDFEEIRSLNVHGADLGFSNAAGPATGRMVPEGLDSFMKGFSELLRDKPYAERILQTFKEAYSPGKNLADATRDFVLEFFGDKGLIVINADTPAFKKRFAGVVLDELLNQRSYQLVKETDTELEKNYNLQVKAREINLFYLTDKQRSRIVKNANRYEVLDSGIVFSEEELKLEVEKHPERFSPNVILRPLYQEMLLPNLAYSGGPAETAYWLQLKKVFDYYKVFYPVLVPRNHAIIIDRKTLTRWEALNLGYGDFFRNQREVEQQVTTFLSGGIANTQEAKSQLEAVYQKLERRVHQTDQTLVRVVKAQLTKAQNGLDRIERKHLAAIKRKEEIKMRHISDFYSVVYPQGVPQERMSSFVSLYSEHGDNFMDVLFKSFRPFAVTVTVVQTL